MWSDNETDTDFLNYSETAALVSETLRQRHLRPISIGLFGGWGVGKSSLMRMVMAEISKDPSHVVLHFDAWLFQDYDDARAALLNKIGDTLYEWAKENEDVRDKVRRLYKRINKLRVLGLLAEGAAFAAGMPTFGAIARGMEGAHGLVRGAGDEEDVEAVKEMANNAKKRSSELLKPAEEESPPQQIEKFRAELKDILEELDCTLFVFVDNLDRCLPDKAIHTLEAVRLFLFMERTAFVIAADEEMIRLAVAQHYKADADRLVTDYLDKLVQIPVRVPRTGVAELRAFLILLLASTPADRQQGLASEMQDKLRSFLIDRLRMIWRDPFPEIDELLDCVGGDQLEEREQSILRQASLLAKRMAPLLVSSGRVSGNPRIVKRMLNTMRMRQMIAARRGITLSEEALAKLVLFERCAGDKATNDLMVLISESKDGKVELLRRLEGDDSIEAPDDFPETWRKQENFIGKWAALEPSLGELDLRPAAYLSRETVPIFSKSAGLSINAERALKVLAASTRQTAPSTTQAVDQIPSDERPAAMEALTSHLSNTASWSNTPKGWAGAIALADKDTDAARTLVTFVKSRNFDPKPTWMKASLKEKAWWSD